MKKALFAIFALFAGGAQAASGGFEDSLADVMTWVILVVMPIGGIYLFWMAHIYPEKVAEKNHHPQLQAIKVMCLLSLFVGGLLWPIALIWASYNYGNAPSGDGETAADSAPLAQDTQEPEVAPQNPTE